jgi:methionyl-tRNA formyltransferase
MKVAIITQEDYFFIPENIKKIADRFGSSSIRTILLIDSKGSINNKKSLFIRGFGLIQSMKYGLKVLRKKLIFFATLIKLSKNNTHSIAGIAKHFDIPFSIVNDINEDKILERLEALNLDIIISFSAPVVFRERLLNASKLGCINLHCSYLPNYAGLFPSFWVLFKDEKFTGCTVHKMDTKIDNGDILMQEKVEISNDDTIFSLLNKTKSIGGNLMIKVIEELRDDNLKPIKNHASEKNYFTWPTLEELYLFRKNGGKLV